MFGSLFRKKAEKTPAMCQQEAITEGFKRAIAAIKPEDPLIGPKVAGKEIAQRLINGYRTDKGVHIETILTALGSMAGYACQASIREEFVKSGKLQEGQAFAIAETKDGKHFFFGDMLNKPLAESQYSVWSLAAGAAQQLGKPVPDVGDIFKHVSATIGSPEFGIPRIPEDHRSDLPISFLKVLWPDFLPVVQQLCTSPSEWPIAFAMAIQQVILMGKDAIDPSMAVSIVMESAIPMSKVDFGSLQ